LILSEIFFFGTSKILSQIILTKN